MGSLSPKKLVPEQFISRWRTQTFSHFESAFADTQFLLIRLESLTDELPTYLISRSVDQGEVLTPVQDEALLITHRFALEGLSSKRESFWNRNSIESRVSQAPHFIAPLRRQAGSSRPFAERICIGRAHNNDIVLRDNSVSKFHAWFECSSDRTFYVCDAQSTNGTIINGWRQQGRPPTRVDPGDEIKFGRVQASLCSAELLWKLMMAEEAREGRAAG